MQNQYQSQAQVQAIFQAPVRDVQNVYGGQQRSQWDPSRIDTSNALRPKDYNRRFQYQRSEQLPYHSAGHNRSLTAEQLVGMPTKASRVCINTAEESQPFYERYWPIWDYNPIQPTCGDLTQDPRYNAQMTKTFTADYKRLVDSPAVPSVRTMHPSYGSF